METWLMDAWTNATERREFDTRSRTLNEMDDILQLVLTRASDQISECCTRLEGLGPGPNEAHRQASLAIAHATMQNINQARERLSDIQAQERAAEEQRRILADSRQEARLYGDILERSHPRAVHVGNDLGNKTKRRAHGVRHHEQGRIRTNDRDRTTGSVESKSDISPTMILTSHFGAQSAIGVDRAQRSGVIYSDLSHEVDQRLDSRRERQQAGSTMTTGAVAPGHKKSKRKQRSQSSLCEAFQADNAGSSAGVGPSIKRVKTEHEYAESVDEGHVMPRDDAHAQNMQQEQQVAVRLRRKRSLEDDGRKKRRKRSA